jgi:hypothetical protein
LRFWLSKINTPSPCRSELARGVFKGGALSQTERIIVLADREQSRSHRNFLRTQFL